MNLVLFDIDGTLLRSMELEERCFVEAFQRALGIEEIDTDWNRYAAVSDAGLAREILALHTGREARPSELTRVHDRFVRLLRQELSRTSIEPMAGAATVLRELSQRQGWHVALATGAWFEAARLKLGSAQLETEGLAMASSDDAQDRAAIARTAIVRAQDAAKRKFERVVLVGDGRWDVRTARRLQVPFVGVAEDGLGEHLRDEGAADVIAGYPGTDEFVALLERAGAP